MKRIVTILLMLLVSMPYPALAGITFHGTTGQTLYARVQIGTSTFESVALTEGSSGGLGVYTVTDAALVSASVTTAGKLPFTIRSGSPSDTANDPIVGDGVLDWTGAVDAANAKFNERGGRIWYVDDTDGTGDTGSFEAPFDTIAAGIAAAANNDTVHIRAGSYTLASVTTIALSNLTIQGDGDDKTLISMTDDLLNQVFNAGTNTTFRGLKITRTGGVACIGGLSTGNNTTIEDCYLEGATMAYYPQGGTGHRVLRSTLSATFSPVEVSASGQVLIDQCLIYCSCDLASATRFCGLMLDSTTATVRNTDIILQQSLANSKPINGIEGGQSSILNNKCGIFCENVNISIQVTNASNTAILSGICDNPDAPSTNVQCTMVGGSIDITSTGSGAKYHADGTGTGTQICLIGVDCGDPATKFNAIGNITFVDKLTKTALANVAPGAAGGVFIAGTNAQTTVTSGFGADSITATSLATDAITAAKVAADTIGASEVAADALGASEIAADAVGASEVAASTITASEAPNLDAAVSSISGGAELQSTTIATLASQVSFTLTAGSADNDAYNGAIAVITDASTATQKAVGVVGDYVGITRTVTLASDPAIFTMAAGDSIDILPPGLTQQQVADAGKLAPTAGAPAAGSEHAKLDGIEVAAVGTPFLQDIPGPAFTIKLGTRRDGTSSTDRPIRIRPGESAVPWAVDCSAILRSGRHLDDMGAPAESSSNADITVGTTESTNYGVNRELAIITVTCAEGAEAGDVGEIEFDVMPAGAATVRVTVPVKVIE